MEQKNPPSPKSNAMVSAKKIERDSLLELGEILCNALKRKVDSQKPE